MKQEPSPAQMIATLAMSLGAAMARIDALDTEVAEMRACIKAMRRAPRMQPVLAQDAVQDALDVCALVAARHGLKLSGIIRNDRRKRITAVRQEAMAECKKAGFSVAVIREALQRDSSTVSHGIRAHEAQVAK
jgi:chromosomal replication initiation ATPase DnaA